MGFTHATSGTAAWLAVTTAALPAVAAQSVLVGPEFALAPAAILSGAIVCAGSALLPDADHPSATIAHSIPVVGKFFTGAIGSLSGGHRHGAHTLLAAVIVTAAAVALGRWEIALPVVGEVALGAALATAALVCFGMKARDVVRSWPAAWFVGILAAVVIVVSAPDATIWFPLAVGVGYVAHLLGDALTRGGIPAPLWPIQPKPPTWWRRTNVLNDIWKRNGYIALPLLGNAGSTREWVVAIALGLYGAIGLARVGAVAFGITLT